MARTLRSDLQGKEQLEITPGQTVGPFFAFGTVYPKMHEVVFPHSPGAIVLSGTVYDGAGAPIPDALVEIWSADAEGNIPRGRGSRRRDDHTFTGFGRSATTDEGRFEFWTINPGSVNGEAPFYAVAVFARGLPDKLMTRIYLPDDQEKLDADPFLSSLTPEERATLIATRLPNGYLRHDIRLQGENETVFLEF
ncbi:protocatechuate 3,4-dioxygenase subunit alpha [Microbacterium sp.]|jgi:protocatechuate 3,4-dioxygenase alpha subunit|uniref:protocatechuate 3,4-dioxygenase subunit alpha n=1 Tax=Microbacterium sp. TaxID=51671 RepID=UPI002B9E4446|nr:protocatechuate 3,4-dioxygenase subunit alpha [Microbacterium sp.]HWL76139.1 protocatechuate 3,4-dioxygenase subunit alpha [Microbacterium sp.]